MGLGWFWGGCGEGIRHAQITGAVNSIERSSTPTLELWHTLQMPGIASTGDAHHLQG